MSKKIELFRQSKGPIEIEDYKKYQAEWTSFYDKVLAKFGTNVEHMERVEQLLNRRETRLIKKYNSPVIIDVPKSEKAIKALCAKYGSPIMMAERTDGKGIVAIIMDELA
jgi:hypothetical protein